MARITSDCGCSGCLGAAPFIPGLPSRPRAVEAQQQFGSVRCLAVALTAASSEAWGPLHRAHNSLLLRRSHPARCATTSTSRPTSPGCCTVRETPPRQLPPAFRCGFTTVRCLKRRLATDNPPSFIVVPLAVRCLTLSGTGITNTMATSSGVVGVQVTAALLDHGCALPSS